MRTTAIAIAVGFTVWALNVPALAQNAPARRAPSHPPASEEPLVGPGETVQHIEDWRKRCEQLRGSLQKECIEQEEEAASGGPRALTERGYVHGRRPAAPNPPPPAKGRKLQSSPAG